MRENGKRLFAVVGARGSAFQNEKLQPGCGKKTQSLRLRAHVLCCNASYLNSESQWICQQALISNVTSNFPRPASQSGLQAGLMGLYKSWLDYRQCSYHRFKVPEKLYPSTNSHSMRLTHPSLIVLVISLCNFGTHAQSASFASVSDEGLASTTSSGSVGSVRPTASSSASPTQVGEGLDCTTNCAQLVARSNGCVKELTG